MMKTSQTFEDEIRFHMGNPENLDLIERHRRAYCAYVASCEQAFDIYLECLKAEGLI